MLRIDIFITRTCQLSCSYCEAVGSKVMSLDTAKEIISFIKKDKHKNYRIIFQGGEPFTNYSVMKFFIEEIKKIKNKRFNVEVLTNLIIWNNEIAEFIRKHNIRIQTSLDGTKKTHNANRRLKDGTGSYRLVVKNLKKALKFFPDIQVKMVCAWSKNKSYKSFKADVDSIIKLGVKNLHISYDYRILDLNRIEKMNRYIQKWYCEYAKHKKNIPPLNSINENLKRIIIPSEEYGKKYIKFGCDTLKGALTIDIDGKVYPCLFYLLANNHRKFSFGHISKLNKKVMSLFYASGRSFMHNYMHSKINLLNNKIKIPYCMSFNYRIKGKSFECASNLLRVTESEIKRDLQIYQTLKKYSWFTKALSNKAIT
ncbi:MAG: radical SAM protein [Candidatus Woesearchaeota archaeon]